MVESRRKQPGSFIAGEHWLHILDELTIGAFIVDTKRCVAAMNLSAQALIGQKDSEAIGKDCREVFVGVPCLAQCPFKSPEDPVTEEPMVRLLDEEQTTHLVTRMASPVYDQDKQIIGCMTILQDHSPIIDLIDRIHYEERSLKLILDNLDVGIFTVDRGGHITFFNTTAEKMSGFNRREILGERYSEMFGRDKDQGLSSLQETIIDGHPRSSHHGKMTTRDGGSIPIRANYMAMRNEKGTIIGGLTTFHDLTLVQQLKQAMKDRYTFHDMIGKSPTMQKIFEMINSVADTDATILIEGATGTGKDLAAKVIHSASRRSEKPFVKVNCAAIPHNLLESEMFGYVKGAFTGAEKDKIGRFHEADGGTIFLDEIGDLPISLQAKLLRVLEDKEFYRLGSRHTSKVNVRIISATNRNIANLVGQRLFREDLYYRINLFHIELPELKDRKIDLPLLIGHILRRLCAAGGTRLPEVSEKVMEILLNYGYPGNVRELENILEHAMIICREETIQSRHLPEYLRLRPAPQRASALGRSTAEMKSDDEECQTIISVLQQHNGHRSLTARALGMDRTTLWRKIKKYGINI